MQPAIIGRNKGIVKEGTFNFYDGKITAKMNKSDNQADVEKGPVAIDGNVDGLPVAYSTLIEDSDNEDE